MDAEVVNVAEQPIGSGPNEPNGQKRKKKKKRNVKKVITLIVVLVIVGLIAFGMYMVFKPEKTDQTALTEFTYIGSIQSTVEGYGLTKPKDSAAVTAAVKGICKEVFFDTGDTVMAGDLLFTIETTDADKLVVEKQDALNTLLEQKQEILDSQAKLTVTAPINGKILTTSVNVGDFVAKDSVIGTMVNDSKMRLKQYFSYAYINDIYEGQAVTVSIPSSMTTLEGTVEKITRVERISDEGSMLFEVDVVLDNPNTLTEGTIASISLQSSSGEYIYPYENGELEYYEKRDIKAGASGTCTSVSMTEYMKVDAGTAVCQLDSDDFDEQIKSIDSQIEAAQLEVNEAQAVLDSYSGYAPISGTIMSNSLIVGEETVIGTSGMTISDNSMIYLEAQIDEMDVSKVSVGQTVEVSQYDENVYYGTVISVSMEGVSEYGVSYFPAMIELPNDGMLMAGMYLNYSFVASQQDNVVVAPVQAVKYTEQGTCLFVKADDKPENAIELAEGVVPDGYWAVPVEVGLSDDYGVEIISGVDADVEVFTQYMTDSGSSYDNGGIIVG